MQGQLPKVPLGLLIWLVAVTAWVTWAPLEARVNEPLRWQLKPALALDMETASHLLLCVPIAALLAVLAHDKPSPKSFRQAWGAVTLLGVFLELGQWWVKGRALSPYDMLANCMGAAVAIWGVAQLMRYGLRARPILVAVGVCVFMGVQVGLIYSVFLLNQGQRLSEWNPRFVVLAGDEPNGRRAYQGQIQNARLCAGTPPSQVCIVPGADLKARQRLTAAAEASHHVEVSANVLSNTDRQVGPARIVTFSPGRCCTNVMLGQGRRHLFFRVRTQWSAPRRGAHPEFMLHDAIETGRPTWVFASYRRGVITMKARSEAGTVSDVFRPNFRRSAIQPVGRRNLPVMWQGRAAYVGVLICFVSLGLAVAWLLRSRWYLAALIGPIVAVSSLWAVSTWVLAALSPGIIEYLVVTGMAELGVGLAVWDRNCIRQNARDRSNIDMEMAPASEA